jgi:DtxR family Mn-dependent transcriptional regulator
MNKDLSRRNEDYLRGIHDILKRKGYARIKDISRELDVKPASATEMARKLDSIGLVTYEKYGGVMLTPRGKEVAKAICERHDTFRKFLEIILVPENIALKDAHVFEHQLDPKTIMQFTKFVEFISQAPEHPRFVGRWLEQFKEYCDKEPATR